MIFGLDLLGLGSKNWEIKDVINTFPRGWALGCFARTFGDALPKVRRLLETGKVAAVRVQIYWSYTHQPAPLKYLKEELPRWQKLARQFPDVDFYISPSCEYRSTNVKSVKRMMDLTKQLCQNCRVVQTPEGGSVTVPDYMVEHHGSKAKAKKWELVSSDGSSITDMNAEAWIDKNKKAQIVFLWGTRFNLREAGDFIPPEERTAAPDAKYIKSIIRLARPKGEMPTPVFQYKELEKPLLWKTHAEDAPGDADKRGNRPLIILRKKTATVDIVTYDDKVIGQLRYFGPFPGGLYRFYSGMSGAIMMHGYEIGEKAKEVSGSEWVWIRQDGKYHGPICAPFRTPFYQK